MVSVEVFVSAPCLHVADDKLGAVNALCLQSLRTREDNEERPARVL